MKDVEGGRGTGQKRVTKRTTKEQGLASPFRDSCVQKILFPTNVVNFSEYFIV